MSDITGAGLADPQLFINIISATRVTQHLCLSGLTLWLWDVLLTVDEEIPLIWKRDRSIIKFLYLIVSQQLFPTLNFVLISFFYC